ncbi:hypothetical protein ASG33_01965 [Dyadobacter sp. Leaf189]|nr:hypothetical protein ASG33_01965 [Dyadobacter sp. Leaf189]
MNSLTQENDYSRCGVNFYQPIYDTLEKKYIERSTTTQQATDFGRDQVKLDSLHKQVKKEISGFL